MYPQQHFIIGLPIFLILTPFIGLSYALVFFLSFFLVDFDHYLAYYKKKKEFSVRNAYYYWKDRHCKDELMIFHTIEFFILLFILAFFSKIFLLIFIAIIFHEILDLIYMEKRKLIGVRAFSIIMWLKRRKFFI